MSRTWLKRIFFIICGAVGLLVLVALVALLFVDVNRYKPRLEADASDALGMDVRVAGRLGMGFFPGFHLTARDGQVLGENGLAVASVKKVSLWIDLVPLLRREVRVRRIELTQPMLSIERDTHGRLNIERLKKAVALLGALDGASASLLDGTIQFVDERSGARIAATNFDLAVNRIRIARRRGPELWKGVSLKAALACGEIRTKTLSVSALEASIDGKDGVFELEPITMRLFGGQATGSLRADASGAVPLYQVRCSLRGFRIEEFLKVLSPKRAAEGAMDFSANLSMQGSPGRQLVQTAAGAISLRSGQLTLVGNDLDAGLSRFESSQNFSLVDVGAVFLAGPLGLAVTKGYNFASLFEGSGGHTSIRTLVSDWRVERGVARAKDVALATTKNRIALRGGLDFVNERFENLTVAAIDAKGCPRAQQTIHGSFGKPTVDKPRALSSLVGPVLKLYRRARGVFPAGPCEVFYSGSVAAPS
jgi:uncharacterized protein involved in outer membrane biogenesis